MKKIFLLAVISCFIFANGASAKSNRDVLFDSLQKVKTLKRTHISTDSTLTAVNKKLKGGMSAHHQGEYYFDISEDLSSPNCHYADGLTLKKYEKDFSEQEEKNTLVGVIDGYRYDLGFDKDSKPQDWTRIKANEADCFSLNNLVNGFIASNISNTTSSPSFFYDFLNKYKNDITVQKLNNQKIGDRASIHYKIVIKNRAYQKFYQDYLKYFKDTSSDGALQVLSVKDFLKINTVNYDIWVDKKGNFPLRTVFSVKATAEDKKNKANGVVVMDFKNTINFVTQQISVSEGLVDLKNNLSAPDSFVDVGI